MRPALLFPDVELWATGYLRAALIARGETVHVDVKDKTTAAKRVIFRGDGGYRANVSMQAVRFGVRVFGGTEKATNDLALLVAALLQAAPGNGPVNSANVSHPFAVADDTGPMRYLTGELRVRGTPLT